jgi:hypothetical protein
MLNGVPDAFKEFPFELASDIRLLPISKDFELLL